MCVSSQGLLKESMFEITSLKIPMTLLHCLSALRGWSRCNPFVLCAHVIPSSRLDLFVKTRYSPSSFFLLTFIMSFSKLNLSLNYVANMSSVPLHSKVTGMCPCSGVRRIWRAAAVCVVPSGLCRTFSQFRSFLLHFLLPASLLKHLFPVFTRLSVYEWCAPSNLPCPLLALLFNL